MQRKAAIFDFNRTLYEVEKAALYEGVKELLEEQRALRRLFLYSKQEGGRDTLLRDLGIEPYFERTYFVPEKTAESVAALLVENDLSASDSLIIGDLITSELAAGNAAGVGTVWLRQGIFADQTGAFSPTHTVHSIQELRELLRVIP